MGEAHAGIPLLREIVVFLVAIGLLVPLFHRFRLSPILGYLIVGIIIGPYALGRLADDAPFLRHVVITDIEGVRGVADLGVVFLLFLIGLELSLDRLLAMRRLVFGLGALQFAITAGLIGTVAYVWGNTPVAAVVIGACLAISSTAMVMQILIDRRELTSAHGRAAFAILLFQDLAIVPVLVMLGILSAAGSQGGADNDVLEAVALSFATAVATVAGIVGAGRFLIRPLFRLVGHARLPELFMATTLLVVIGAAAITGGVGLSTALGAFLAGLLLAETEWRHQIEVDIEPFKGILLALFFISVGMGIDLAAVIGNLVWVAVSVIGLFVLKALIITGLARLFGQPPARAVEIGLLLGQSGEFAFVVLSLALHGALLPFEIGQFMLTIVGATMLATPAAAMLASFIGRRIDARHGERGPTPPAGIADEHDGHVVICGFGRVGETVAIILDDQQIPFIGLELNPNSVRRARAAGWPVYYADARRLEVLRKVGAERAAAVIITLDDPLVAEAIVAELQRSMAHVPTYARARDTAHAQRLIALGAGQVVPETVESSLQLAGRVLEGMGVTTEQVALMLANLRETRFSPGGRQKVETGH